ncbi:hypothetical protein RSAG8_00220, partial [Rhizoctonia solani AG-8 WAC10335]
MAEQYISENIGRTSTPSGAYYSPKHGEITKGIVSDGRRSYLLSKLEYM